MQSVRKTLIIFVIPFLLLFSLGLWQLLRLSWKNGIIHNMNLPVIHLTDSDKLSKFNYRNVKINGILSDIELYVFAGQDGYYVLSPMLLTTGRYMLVNKGIVREKKEGKVKIQKTTLTGVLYCDGSKNWFIKNDTASNTWFTLSTKEISNDLGIILEQCILWQGSLAKKLTIQPIKHLEYAITWFSLSFVWLIMYIFYYRENRYKSVER